MKYYNQKNNYKIASTLKYIQKYVEKHVFINILKNRTIGKMRLGNGVYIALYFHLGFLSDFCHVTCCYMFKNNYFLLIIRNDCIN